MDTNNKNFRQDRSCEACGNEGAALVSSDVESMPRYLCEPCMKFSLNRGMTNEEVITMVENIWKIEANAEIDTCPDCQSDRIIVRSIDDERYFTKCKCGTSEGFKRTRFFRIG